MFYIPISYYSMSWDESDIKWGLNIKLITAVFDLQNVNKPLHILPFAFIDEQIYFIGIKGNSILCSCIG